MGSDARPLGGGCACRAVRYQARGGPIRMLNCHCRDCQRASGSAFAPLVVVDRSQLEIAGELRYHATTGNSFMRVERGFCPICGSPVAIRLDRAPQVVALHAASLDDPSVHTPTLDAYTDSAQAWDVMAAGTDKFPRDWRGD